MIKPLQLFLILTIFCSFIPAASGQRRPLNSRQGNYSRSRVVTPYFQGRGAYGGQSVYGAQRLYGGQGTLPYASYATPVPVTPSLPPVTGPVEKYSAVEYGEIVQMAVEAARRNNPGGAIAKRRVSIVDKTTATLDGETAYMPVESEVSDILDRGILLLPTGEEMRLRGVTMPSNTDTNDVLRLYAKEGIQGLRNIIQGHELYIILDNPLRDRDGRLLGTVVLANGTDINRRMLELGYGSLKSEDFARGVDFKDLEEAQKAAQAQRLGVWSR